MARPYLSIIIPVYNEAARIPKTLLDIDWRLARAPYSYEIIVVNDGSTDNTAEVAERMKAAVKNLKVIDNAENKGKGAAVRHGMLVAGGTVRLFADADNSTSIDHFDRMVPLFKEGYGVVIGSRAAKGASLAPAGPLVRRIVGKGSNLAARALLLRGIRDTRCGFKAFTEDAAKKVFEIAQVPGRAFDVEALALARDMGYRIAEVPVRWAADASSRAPLSAGPQFLRDVVRTRWRLSHGGYSPLDTAKETAA